MWPANPRTRFPCVDPSTSLSAKSGRAKVKSVLLPPLLLETAIALLSFHRPDATPTLELQACGKYCTGRFLTCFILFYFLKRKRSSPLGSIKVVKHEEYFWRFVSYFWRNVTFTRISFGVYSSFFRSVPAVYLAFFGMAFFLEMRYSSVTAVFDVSSYFLRNVSALQCKKLCLTFVRTKKSTSSRYS